MFEQYKSIQAFSAEYEKNPAKLHVFAAKDQEIEIQFPSNFIEQQKKKHFHNKMNKVSRGYAPNHGEQNGYQPNHNRHFKPKVNNNPMLVRIS